MGKVLSINKKIIKNPKYHSTFYILSKTLCILFLLIPNTLFGQIFQNNHFSCEDIILLSPANAEEPAALLGNPFSAGSIDCGNLNNDSDQGYPDFPDCVTQRDPIPINDLDELPISNHLIYNSGAHGDNCFNAGEANRQFKTNPIPIKNKSFEINQTGIIRMGGIKLGKITKPQAGIHVFDDIVTVNAFGTTNDDFIASIQSLDSDLISGFNAQELSFNSLFFDDSLWVPFPNNSYGGFPLPKSNLSAERSLNLINCDEDEDEEAVLVVKQYFNEPGVYLLQLVTAQNSGMGFESMDNEYIPNNFPKINDKVNVSITNGDFNGDEILDIIAAINHDSSNEMAPPDQILFCQGEKNCSFNCLNNSIPFILSGICQNNICDPHPKSIQSGDFNGDGLIDVAVALANQTEVQEPSILYLFNDGNPDANLQTWKVSKIDIPIDFGVSTVFPTVIDRGKFSPLAFQNNTDEVVVSIPQFVYEIEDLTVDYTKEQLSSRLAVIPTDGNGGLLPVQFLEFTPENSHSASGLSVLDADHCGGDDIVALSETINENSLDVTQRMSLFLNINEPPDLQLANAMINTEVNTTIKLFANCQDPTNDRRYFEWDLVEGPQGANVIFSKPTGELNYIEFDASTEFKSDQAGDYLINASCTDFCGKKDSKSILIKIEDPGTSSGDSGIDDTPDATDNETTSSIEPEISTQGGCIANLNQRAGSSWIFPLALFFILSKLKLFSDKKTRN